MRITFILLCAFWLCACVEPAIVTGQPGPALSSEEVDVYYVERPRCEFETVAHIRVNGGYFSLQAMLRNMRQEAAELGAGGLYVLETRTLDNREVIGTAKAIRCLPT